MQLEWNKWLSGLITFKEDQGLLLLLCFAVLGLWLGKSSKNEKRLLILVLGLGILVLCPLSAIVLLKGYTPFYDWMDLQLIFPSTLLLGYGGTVLVMHLSKKEIPGLRIGKSWKSLIAWFCTVIILLVGTTFHSFDVRSKATDNGVPIEVAEVLKPIKDKVGENSLVVAAPSEILLYTRLYEEAWKSLYGRDLWSPKAAGYINSGYDVEYQYYELLEKDWLEQEEFVELKKLILAGPAECVIVPCGWIAELDLPTDCLIIEGNDFYTGIIKKDLVTE